MGYEYFIYTRPAGEKRYLLSDLPGGLVGVKAMYAPRYKENDFDRLKNALDRVAIDNPGMSFQLRKINGGKTVFTTDPVFTPETFLETI